MSQGQKVIVAGTGVSGIAAAKLLLEIGGEVVLYDANEALDAEELKGFVEDTVRTFGRIDMVVSNAGMNVFEGAEGCTEERWHYNLDLNLASHWRLARLCKPISKRAAKASCS